MTTCKVILTPTNKEQKICHALATTSAFNLKLCHTKSIYVYSSIKLFIYLEIPTNYLDFSYNKSTDSCYTCISVND